MNENTEKLLTGLAEKLGTTVELLWGVLIKQAPIWGCTQLFYLLILFIILWAIWSNKNKVNIFEIFGDGEAGFVGIVFLLVFGFLALIILFSVFNLNLILASFFNPEYWALMKILNRS